MRDFYPQDLDLRDRIFAAWTDASNLHGFQRFEPPVVESFELLARKAGEEVAQQIYHFEDKSNRQLALRPEVTPSLVRMISARPQEIRLLRSGIADARQFLPQNRAVDAD